MKKILTLFVFVAIIGYFYYSSYHHTRECVGKHCMTSSVPESCYLKSKNFRTETFDPRKRFAFEVERSFKSLEMIDAHTNRTVGHASIQGPDTKEYTYQYTETPLMCVPPKSLVFVSFGTSHCNKTTTTTTIIRKQKTHTVLMGIFMKPSTFNTIVRCAVLSLLFMPTNKFETKTVSRTIYRSKATLHYVVDEQKYDKLPILFARVDQDFRSRGVKYQRRGKKYVTPLEFEKRPGMDRYESNPNEINVTFVPLSRWEYSMRKMLSESCDLYVRMIPNLRHEDLDDILAYLFRYPIHVVIFIQCVGVIQSLLSALAFKIMTDPYVGKLTYMRVYSGSLNAGSYVYNPSSGKRERISRILLMHSNKREERDAVSTGEIVAAVGLKTVKTGHTLCDEKNQIILESMDFPEPVVAVSVEPVSKGDQDSLSIGLQKLGEEDPTFKVETNEETGQTIISGMGELHLEILIDRLLREFKVQANIGKPMVAYREAITKRVEDVDIKFARQSGGRGQYGHVVINVEPNDSGKGYHFENKIVGGVIPKEYIPSVDKGMQEALKNGIIAGYPIEDVRVELIYGSYHDVDSSEMAFKIAGSMAIQDACKKASPKLMEPIMEVEVVTPDEYLGDVMGDISSRRGKIDGMSQRNEAQVIKANVPLGNMFGYVTDLRSITQGRAVFHMQFSHYYQVPASVETEIMEKVHGKAG